MAQNIDKPTLPLGFWESFNVFSYGLLGVIVGTLMLESQRVAEGGKTLTTIPSGSPIIIYFMSMKSIFKSKVIWFNAVTILVVVATFFGYTPDQELAVKTSNILLLLGPAINFALRFFTSKPVSITGE